MGTENWSLIGRLKRVVKKITFLLNVDMNRWKLVSSLIGASSRRQQLSFKERMLQRQPTGLTVICIENDNLNNSNEDSGSNSFKGLQRTMSFPSSEDDIDKRAELFIENFYKQLRLERQVSLELRYCRGKSFTSSPSP